MTPSMIVIAIIVLLAVYVAFAYNKFMKLIQRSKEAWADIDSDGLNPYHTENMPQNFPPEGQLLG